jgi:hypothetical protein
MDLVPPEHERKALLDGLAKLIEARGIAPFVAAPLLEPHPRFFPDPWEPSARGVRALSLRLLRYAGGDDLDAQITLEGGPDDASASGVHQARHEGAVAWFAGIEDGVCIFGVDASQLAEDDAIAGTLCHEVAHAYRAWTGLAEGYDRLEEESTDLTTVYLGFGILTTNNAYRFRKRGLRGTAFAGTEWSSSQTGYLSPQAMAFALAAQVTARTLPAAEVKRIGRLLETNQRAFFVAACKLLAPDVDGLRGRLGVPPEQLWPAPVEQRLAELPEDARFVPDRSVRSGSARSAWNEGGNVFRVRHRKTASRAFVGVVLGGFAGGLWHETLGLDLGWAVLGGVMLLAIPLALLGRRRVTDRCSDSQCGVVLPPATATCPRCHGRIRGVIFDANDRLAAEEALED